MINFVIEKFRIRSRLPGESFSDYYAAHELPFGTLVFLAGFLFDIFTLSNVDDPFSLSQQAVYLIFIGWALYYEILEAVTDWKPGPKMQKFWGYREFLLHFFLGSLLSIYSLFYFKSASLSTSFVFILLMMVLLVANELPQLQKKGPIVRLSLWTLCLSSFFLCLLPTLLGFGGSIPFFLSIVLAGLILLQFLKFLRKRHPDEHLRMSTLFIPAIGVLVFYFVAFFMKWVPPLPLALKTIGIYHNIEKQNGEFILTAERPWWRFWHKGDQLFYAKPGDKVYVFAAVYAPAKFADEIKIRWLYKDKRGWNTSDLIPMRISGGRGEGYRGYAFKSNHQPGEWRVQIETIEGLEIGRIGLEIVQAQP